MYAKKALGQHFLNAPSYLRAMCDAGGVEQEDVVLEIGPGRGALTRELLSRGARVIAVEKDRELIPVLEAAFGEAIARNDLHIVEGDALTFDPGTIKKPFKLIANVPYYITGALFEHFLSAQAQPTRLVFLVQKELAERAARDKKESIFSLSLKAYGTPKYIKTVPRGAFSPAPQVDSAILLIEQVSRNNFENEAQEKKFFELIRAGFAHKRKLLARNIEGILGEGGEKVLEGALIPQKARAEDIPLQKWLALAHKLVQNEG